MHPHVLAAVILLPVSSMVWLIGYRIRARKQLSLIAGLDPAKVRDRDGLARWIGTGLQRIGVLDLLISLVVLAKPALTPLLIVVYVAVNLSGTVGLLIRMRRYIR